MVGEHLQVVSSSGRREGQKILALKGPLNLEGLPRFHAAAREGFDPVLILDFTLVPYLDSAGLGALVATYVSAQRSGRRLALVGVNERTRSLLEMTRLIQLFRFFPTVAEAEDALD
jgi:anti-sigma B factor antagonist